MLMRMNIITVLDSEISAPKEVMLDSTSVRTATAARITKMKTNSFLRLDFFCPTCSETCAMGE